MQLPQTADGATICYGDTVYYMFWGHDGSAKYAEPQIRSLVIASDNITLVQGLWLIYRKECSSPLHPKDVYRDRRRLVTICRKYWREKVKEVRAKLKVWNDDVKIRKLCNVIQANQT
jgi:hypothetical protein